MGSFLSLDPERRRSSSGDYYDEYFFIQKLHFLYLEFQSVLKKEFWVLE
jgi:hypothetical protein